MTSLRLFETDSAAAEHTTSHLFETTRRSERRRARGWPYASSVALHSMAMISMVILGRYVSHAPRSTPSHQTRKLAHAFVYTGFGPGRSNRPSRKTQLSAAVPVAVTADVAPAPSPPSRGDVRAPDTNRIVEEKPPQPAFDPPIPPGDSRLTGRRGDPAEADLGSATASSVRGLPSGEVKSGGLGDGNVHSVGTGPPGFNVRPGLDDGGGGGGATPPLIQEPLPIPDYPAAARTRRLQGIVVLEVMLDSLGKAHVRGVLSDPLGFGIEEAATNAAEKLKFTPARQGGRFVDAIVQVRVTFTLMGSATAVTGGA